MDCFEANVEDVGVLEKWNSVNSNRIENQTSSIFSLGLLATFG